MVRRCGEQPHCLTRTMSEAAGFAQAKREGDMGDLVELWGVQRPVVKLQTSHVVVL
jgi:hypothetical protein